MKSPRKIFQTLIYLLVLFVIQEVALRVFFPLPEISNLDRISYLELGKEGSRYTRNETRFWQSSLDTSEIFVHEMNRYGFRDKEWKVAKPEGKKRVLFIGDSFVEGIMAGQEETIPAGFEAKAGPEKYEVLNAGMVGQGLDAYLQLAADIIPVFKPDVAILCIYANDLGETEPAVPQFYLEPEYFNWYSPRFITLLRESRQRGPLRAIWDGSSRAYLPSVPTPANPWTENETALSPHVDPEVAVEMKQGTFNPFRTNALAKEEKYLKLPPKLGETIPFFQYSCEQSQTQPVVVYIPSRNQVTTQYYSYEGKFCQVDCPDSLDLTRPKYQLHQRVIAGQCQRFSIPFIDLSPLIRQEEEKGNNLFWQYDEHMKGKGYLLLGNAIAERWAEFSD